MIHNGIIENYATLKERLQQRGVKFRSQTDSEVLVQLIEYIQVSNDLDLLGAVQVALHEVIGAYAIAILDKRHPEQIIAARKSSPLVVGIGRDNEFYLASDATPIVEYTDKVVYLEDGDIAVIRPGDELKVVDMDNTRMHPTVKTVDINLGQLEKGGYPYFMLKEIFEQPDCLLDCMRGRINIDADNVTLSAVIDHKDKLLSASRFVARGAYRPTAYRELLPYSRVCGICVGVPLPQSCHFAYRRSDCHIAVRRDGRHVGRHRTGTQARGFCVRYL